MTNTENTPAPRSPLGIALATLVAALVALAAMPTGHVSELDVSAGVGLVLTRIGGIPLLQVLAQCRWGDNPNYRHYRDTTPALWPRPPRAPAE